MSSLIVLKDFSFVKTTTKTVVILRHLEVRLMTANDKHEFVPRDQVSPLLTFHYDYVEIGSITPFLSIRIDFSCCLSAQFLF